MVSFLQFYKEQNVKNFKKSYKDEVHDVEKTYLTAKKAYESALKKFVKRNITHISYQELFDRAYDFTSDSYRMYLKPNQLDVLIELVAMHETEIQDDDFYEIGC